ncbi:MAG: hybrid sensor histidine kinase/response regulator, partial [Desulfobacteraceae bacterium]|nr:hybrid sensor histidine kinase/response regulator [Desulfobacteraceae bacterium]
MCALDRVPRFSRNAVEIAMNYYSRLVEIISTLSYSNLKLARTYEEHKQNEREREKIQAQLNQAQKMESVGRLAGGVAHDFNNMLGIILGHTELALLKTDEDDNLVSDLNEIQKAAKRSADITKQLLAFARKEIISPKQIALNDTIESMLNMLRRLIGEDIDLVWQPGSHLWRVKMDPSQIDQILANLCINARDAIADVGKLTIETGKKTFDEEYCNEHTGFIPGDFVLLAVSDNGSGMDKDTLANLFEPFFTTKETGRGTGLGLSTVYG